MIVTPKGFISIAAIRARHIELMESREEIEDAFSPALPPSMRNDVEEFLAQVVATGSRLGFAGERAEAQGIVTYWTSVLQEGDPQPRALILDRFDPKVAEEALGGRNPYRGLLSFGEEDADLFFGRRELISAMLQQLARAGSVAVLGVSGSGKSSLIRAGLLPALHAGSLPGSRNWAYIGPFVPGSNPMQAMAQALSRIVGVDTSTVLPTVQALRSYPQSMVSLLGGRQVLIVIDQLEEIFTLAEEPAREEFLQALAKLLAMPERLCGIVVTMRSEFDTRLLNTKALQVLDDSRIRVPAMQAAELVEVIERPASMFGVTFDSQLTQDLVRNIQHEPAGLPLLQFALMKLWERRTGSRITMQVYQELGGSPQQILVNAAAAVYDRMLEQDRIRCRELFLQLIKPGDSLEVTSQRRKRADLDFIGPSEEVDALIQRLVNEGLLRVTGGKTPRDAIIEISHESLTRNWPELVDWVQSNLSRLRRRQLLRETARQWKKTGGVTLYSGAQLREALEFPALTSEESEFLTESQKAERNIMWIRRAALAVVAFLVLVVMTVLWLSNTVLIRKNLELQAALDAEKKAQQKQTTALAATKELIRVADDAAKSDPHVARVPGTQLFVFFPCAAGANCDEARLVATAMVAAARKTIPGILVPRVTPADPARFTSFSQKTEVRYFNSTDEANAKKLADACARYDSVEAMPYQQAAEAGHLEVWVGKNASLKSGSTGGPW